MAKILMRDMTIDDLKVRLADMSEEIFKLRFRLTTQPLDNPLRIRTVRRDIARLNTFIRQRELGGAEPVAAPAKPRAAAKAAAPKRAPRKAAAKKTAAKKVGAKKSPARKRRET
jgi:large subunit ribosomal protein L29